MHDVLYALDMGSDLRFHGRRKPSLMLRSDPVVESRFAVTGLPVTPAATVFPARGQFFRDVRPQLEFRRIQLLFFRAGRKTDRTAPRIDPQIDGLYLFSRFVQETDGERTAPDHFGFSALQQSAYFAAALRRHERLSVSVLYIDRHTAAPFSFLVCFLR